jgi:hypothetical protein
MVSRPLGLAVNPKFAIRHIKRACLIRRALSRRDQPNPLYRSLLFCRWFSQESMQQNQRTGCHLVPSLLCFNGGAGPDHVGSSRVIRICRETTTERETFVAARRELPS